MIDDAMFACLLDELILSFCYSDLRLETGGLTKCASLPIHTPSYSCTYRHKHIYIPKHIHVNTQIYIYIHSHIYSCTHSYLHLFIQTYADMHSHIRILIKIHYAS